MILARSQGKVAKLRPWLAVSVRLSKCNNSTDVWRIFTKLYIGRFTKICQHQIINNGHYMHIYGNFEDNSPNIYRSEKSYEQKLSRKMKHFMPSTLFPESYELRDSGSKGYLCCVNLRTIRRFESLRPIKARTVAARGASGISHLSAVPVVAAVACLDAVQLRRTVVVRWT
jgi:hypothetical protein